MKSLFFLLSPVLAPCVPKLVFKKLKPGASALIWSLTFGIATVWIIRGFVFVPHEKSPELSRVYDLIFYTLAFMGRIFLSAGVLWLLARFIFKKTERFVTCAAAVGLTFWPLLAIVATDTLFLSDAFDAGIAVFAESWHGLALTFALCQWTRLSLKQAILAASSSFLMMLVFFDDVWGLARLLP